MILKVMKLKKVLLIGDSIRKGYDKYVKRSLSGVAEVYYPEENCRFTTYILKNIPVWKGQLEIEDADLVHWNAGLWDNLIMVDGEHLISLKDYSRNVERICKMIKHYFPSAKMIFATSTPVLEDMFKGDVKRLNKDIEAYNTAAAEIVKRYGGEINDLYALMKSAPAEYHSDSTHWYTKGGTELITEQVINSIEKALNIKGKALDYNALFSKETDIVGI